MVRSSQDVDGELMRLLHHHGSTTDKSKGGHFWNTGNGNGLLYPTMLVAAIAVIGFSLFGIATMTGYLPNMLSESDEAETASTPPSEPAMVACANCGVVSSMRPIEKGGVVDADHTSERGAVRPSGRAARPQSRTAAPQRDMHYQIKVHMSDGSYRSFDYGTAPQVTIGQRVRVVDGRIVAGD